MKVHFELCQLPVTGRHYLLYQFESGWTLLDFTTAADQARAAIAQLPEDELVDSIICIPPHERFNFTNLILDIRRAYDDPINNRIRSTYIVGLGVFGRIFIGILAGIAQKFSPDREIHLEYNTLEEALEAMKARG